MIIEVNIPEERKPAVIGKGGKVRKLIEKKTGTKIDIGETVTVKGESVSVFTARDIVRAIGRGFPPEQALCLMKEDWMLSVISLRDKTEKGMKRVLSRIIGSEGKARRRIEEDTGALLVVYGKTVSIIGDWKAVDKATKAVELIIMGRSHKYVYKSIGEKVRERYKPPPL